MARRLASIAVAIFGIFLMTSPAWAVLGTVEFNVIDQAGNAVDGVKVYLTFKGPLLKGEAKVARGRREATLTLNDDGEGEIGLQAGPWRVEVIQSEHALSHMDITVVGGETTRADFTLFPIFAWMVQSPAGCFGCFGLGAGYAGNSLDDMDITEATEIVTDFFFGNPLGTFVFTDDPNQLNQVLDNKLTVNSGLAELAFGFPKVSLFGTTFFPAGFLAVGGAAVELEVKNKVTGQRLQFPGSGPAWGAGVSVIGLWCAACQGYAGVDYRFSMFDAGVSRSQPLLMPGVGTVLVDNVNLSSHSHSIQGIVGYSVLHNHLSPYGGVRFTWYRATFDGNFLIDFGGGFTSNTSFSTKFEEQTTRGVFGVDARLPGTPLFARVEGATDGSNYSVLVKFVYGVGFVDP